MKTFYIVCMILGGVLMCTVETEIVSFYILNASLFTFSAYKLGLFEDEKKESKAIKEAEDA